MQEFPYEEYKQAIEAESNVRNAGVEAVVLNVESDETRHGCFRIGVEFLGNFVESLYENGSVYANGVEVGSLVDVHCNEDGFVVVKGETCNMPAQGGTVKFLPADYLRILREFSAMLVEKPELRNEYRFLNLRDELLKCTDRVGEGEVKDRHLREAQRYAIEETIDRDFSMLWGPPGTGKSYTLGHIAAHYRKKGKRILLLSTTNAAVDVTTIAIDDACSLTGSPLRNAEVIRYSQTTTQPEEYERRRHLTAYADLVRRYAEEERRLVKQLKSARNALETATNDELLRARIKVAGLISELHTLGMRRHDDAVALVNNARIVCCTICSAMYNGFLEQGFDVVLIDEASLVPRATWPYILNIGNGKKFVVAGDPMQLEPVQARSDDLGAHCWFDQNLYSYLGMTTIHGILPFYEAGSMTLLNEQTRMRKGICNIVSKMFYNDLLTGDRTDERMEFSDSGLSDGDVEILDPSKSESYGLDRLSPVPYRLTNVKNAECVIRTIKSVVGDSTRGRRISILIETPFRNQAYKVYWPLLKRLGVNSNVDIRVSTIHSCQGDEADLVFLDLVDPSNNFIARSDAAHIWCVACSRARHKLVIVGSRGAMRLGRYSNAILNMVEKGACK